MLFFSVNDIVLTWLCCFGSRDFFIVKLLSFYGNALIFVFSLISMLIFHFVL